MNISSSDIADMISANSSITKLVLRQMALDSNAAMNLAIGLGNNRTLINLDLRDNHSLGEPGVAALAMANIKALQVLNLYNTNSGHIGGLRTIRDLIAHTPSLIDVQLSGEGVTVPLSPEWEAAVQEIVAASEMNKMNRAREKLKKVMDSKEKGEKK